LKKVILSLGTNLGNKLENLKNAIKYLESVPDTEILKISKVYETEPFEVPDEQDNYYNCCILLKTTLEPQALLNICLKIESKMGRKKPYKNASRIIDIDLIFYEGITCNKPNLILPHPRTKDRIFVLVPMLDILSPGDKLRKKINTYLKNLNSAEIEEIGFIK